jgi:hypothetical protein
LRIAGKERLTTGSSRAGHVGAAPVSASSSGSRRRVDTFAALLAEEQTVLGEALRCHSSSACEDIPVQGEIDAGSALEGRAGYLRRRSTQREQNVGGIAPKSNVLTGEESGD